MKYEIDNCPVLSYADNDAVASIIRQWSIAKRKYKNVMILKSLYLAYTQTKVVCRYFNYVQSPSSLFICK